MHYVDVVDARVPRHIDQLSGVGVITPIKLKDMVLKWRHYTETCAGYYIYRLHEEGVNQPLEPIIDTTFNPRERLTTFQFGGDIILSPCFKEDYDDILPVENVGVYALIKPEMPKTR